MGDTNRRICPVERSGSLDNKLRRWLQNPRSILQPYITEGMTVLDVGCGPGFFSIEMARMVGDTGRVIASDLQAEMLDKLKAKISGTDLEARMTLHRSGESAIGLFDTVDFILLFYMVHEVSNKEDFFRELGGLLSQGGKVLMVEPPCHVSSSAFEKSIQCAREAGFTDHEGPRVLLSKTRILTLS